LDRWSRDQPRDGSDVGLSERQRVRRELAPGSSVEWCGDEPEEVGIVDRERVRGLLVSAGRDDEKKAACGGSDGEQRDVRSTVGVGDELRPRRGRWRRSGVGMGMPGHATWMESIGGGAEPRDTVWHCW
jgi:hypothetical protein